MDRLKGQAEKGWFARKRTGYVFMLLILLLAAGLVMGGCNKNQEQGEHTDKTGEEEPSDLDQKTEEPENEAASGEGEEGNLPEGSAGERDPGQTGNGSEAGDAGHTSGSGTGEKDPAGTESDTDNTDEEERLTIERVGEPISYEAEDGTPIFLSSLYYPFISIPENPEAAERINEVFETQQAEDKGAIADYQEMAQTAYQERQNQEEDTFLNFALDRDYIVTFSGERLLCISEVEYSYAGGVHPNSRVLTWNFDLETGDVVSWDQITDDLEGFLGFLTEKIQTFFETEQMMDGMTWSEALYPNYEEMLPQRLENPNWYIEEGNIILVFDPYDIAPYAAGSITVTVPLADCEGYWNEYGREVLPVSDNY